MTDFVGIRSRRCGIQKCGCKSVSGMGKGNNQAEQVFDATKSIVED
jgi:hypothetical protein